MFRSDFTEGLTEPLCAVGGATGPFQEVTEAEGGVHDSVTEGGAVLRREVQSAVKPAAFPGELKEGFVHLRRVVLDRNPAIGREELVSKH